jgi:uncharacterized membrane protein YfcA
MTASVFLFLAIFIIALVLTMVGLGGGLIFSPLFVILGFAKADAASASLFLNLIAAASAAYTYSQKKMVDFSLAIPLIVSSGLAAPIGSFLNSRVDTKPFLVTMSVVLALAGCRMLMAPPKQANGVGVGRWKKIIGGFGIGICIGLMGGFLGIGGGVFVVPLLIYVLNTPQRSRQRLQRSSCVSLPLQAFWAMLPWNRLTGASSCPPQWPLLPAVRQGQES